MYPKYTVVLFCSFGVLANIIFSQRIVYNKTYCNEDKLPIKLQTVLPNFPAYAMSISSSTYQAGEPISIEVKGCKNNGFRAFLLRASVQGYFLLNKNHNFKNTNFRLGTITVSCGVKKHSNNHVEYSQTSPNNIMTFRWNPPFGSHGNITFHFTAVPKIPSVFWLKFVKSYRQGPENQILVEQQCVTISSARHPKVSLWMVLLCMGAMFLNISR